MSNAKLEKLHKRREALLAQIRREEAKDRQRSRADDTRRKILAGAAVLEHAEDDAVFKQMLDALLARFLVRDHDRALFGLDPLPAPTAAGSGSSDAAAAA